MADGINGSGECQIKCADFFAVFQKHIGFFRNFLRKHAAHSFFFFLNLCVDFFYFIYIFVNFFSRFQLQRYAHIVLVDNLEFRQRLNSLKIRIRLRQHDVKLRCKLHTLCFSELLSLLLLLFTNQNLVFPFLSAKFGQFRTELIVYVEGVHPVARRIQLVEQVLCGCQEIFLRHGVYKLRILLFSAFRGKPLCLAAGRFAL